MFGISHDEATEYLMDGLDVESVRRLAHQQQILVQPDGLHELAREAFINGVINELEHLPRRFLSKPRAGRKKKNLADLIYGKTTIEEE